MWLQTFSLHTLTTSLSDPHTWLSLVTLTLLEIVLGIDNIVFLTILVGKLPHAQRASARILGLGFAMLTRILLLFSIVWVMHLTKPLFEIFGTAISVRDLILLFGGLFLIIKGIHEIQQMLSYHTHPPAISSGKRGFIGIIFQIGLIDIVFSLDSVITAVGLAQHTYIMVLAIVIAIGVMMICAKPIDIFVERYPTIKMLALSFLVLVGLVLMAEGCTLSVPKGYLYFAMGFSGAVECLNIKLRKKLSQTQHIQSNTD